MNNNNNTTFYSSSTENKARKRSAIILTIAIVAIIVILAVAVISAIIPSEIHPKDEIRNNMQSEPFLKGTVSSYLRKWKLPSFEGSILDAVESTFESYYYKDVPEERDIAIITANIFLDNYYDTINLSDSDAVELALVDCMISAIGDRYAYYRTAPETEDYQTNMSGNFVGIGVTVLRNDKEKTILVTGTEAGSPAELAGILPGDYIIGVDGEAVSDIGAISALDKIKGEVGTVVNVTLKRADEEMTLSITREKIIEKTVTYHLLENSSVAYVKISSFKSNTAEQFVQAIDAITEAGAEAIIFDLRGNPGGYINAVRDMLSYLVPSDTKIASFESLKANPNTSNIKEPLLATHGEGSKFEADKDHVLAVPSVVLCDSSSASGAELFSAGMQDFDDMELLDCTVIGEVTFKKGVMQTTFTYTDNSTLTLTTHLYNPPSGENYNEIGVIPDVMLGDDTDYIISALELLGKTE